MRDRSCFLQVFALLLGVASPLVAQTADIQQKIETDLAFKRLQGIWVPDLLLTTEGAEAYPLVGRALSFDGSTFLRREGKRTVAIGSFKIEPGYLRLTIKERRPWDLESTPTEETMPYAFKIDGDLLTLSYSIDNKGKPGDLTPGEDKMVVVYKRQRTDSGGAKSPPKP